MMLSVARIVGIRSLSAQKGIHMIGSKPYIYTTELHAVLSGMEHFSYFPDS